MATTDNLGDFLTDVANAIRTKKGTVANINAQNFSSEIASISSGTDVSDTTAIVSDVVYPKSFYKADGTKVTGTIQTYTPSEVTQNGTLPTANKYVSGNIVVNVSGDSGDELKSLIERSITSISIPSGTTKIGNRSFISCTGLTNVTVPNTVTSIETYAFSNCENLVNINIPNSVTSIGASAFVSTTKLTSITIPNSITTLENNIFHNSGLTSVTLQDGLTILGEAMFYFCRSLQSITIPSGITVIPKNCFSNTGLNSATIPSSVTTYGDMAFNSTKFTTVTIPSTVTSIGSSAFASNNILTVANVYTTSSTQKATSVGGAWFYYSGNSDFVIHAPSSLDATTSITAFGQYWNYKTSSVMHTTYYDL